MFKIPIVYLTRKCLFMRVSPLLLMNKECASHFRRETAIENEQLKEKKLTSSDLISQTFYHRHTMITMIDRYDL